MCHLSIHNTADLHCCTLESRDQPKAFALCRDGSVAIGFFSGYNDRQYMTENELPVQVFRETELVERLESNGHVFSHCISIRNPDQQMPAAIRAAFKSILELKFYDVESADQLGPAQAIKRVPERRDVRGVVEYFRVTRSDASGYTIHCWQVIFTVPGHRPGHPVPDDSVREESGRDPEAAQA